VCELPEDVTDTQKQVGVVKGYTFKCVCNMCIELVFKWILNKTQGVDNFKIRGRLRKPRAVLKCIVEGKSSPITCLDRPRGFQEVEAPRLLESRYMKVVRLSALRTGRLYPAGNIPGTHFCLRLSRPQGHCATDRIMPMKKSTDTIGNRTRDLPVCSAVAY
jgi:hypothetical protein